MGLNIYFLDSNGEDVEQQTCLNITHNMSKLVDECGKLVGEDHYELVWRPDELFGVDNGKVPVKLIINRLPVLINDLIENETELTKHLPSNGWGTFEGLICFLCAYLKECYIHKDSFVYCCR